MSVQACAEAVAEGDPARFRVVMTMPVSLRERLLPILAFNLEVARAPYVTAEPMIAQIRLQWWRDCLDEIYNHAKVRRHTVSTPLASVIRNCNLPRASFDELIEARQTDIEGFDFHDWDALWHYLASSGGALLAICAAAACIEGAAYRIGTGFAAAAWLRAASDLESRGGRILPNRDGIGPFCQKAFTQMQDCGSLQPISRFGYLAPLTLRRARARPAAIWDGGLEPSPLRAQAAFIRSLW
ncbi:MAG: squalene/phytoene synthase family protein [Pseudomonadota bacterium]